MDSWRGAVDIYPPGCLQQAVSPKATRHTQMSLFGGVVGGTNSAVSAAMRRKPRQTRKHHQRYQPLPLHDVQGVLLDKPLAPFLLAVASVGTGAVCGVASGFMVGGPIGSAAGGLFGAAIGAAVLHRASLFPQGVEACRAELEEITVAQMKLAANRAKVEAVIANKYGQPTKVYHLEPEKLGALLHATQRNAARRLGAPPP